MNLMPQNKSMSLCNLKYIVLITILAFCCMQLRAATKRALLVGISEYPINKNDNDASWSPIHGTNDVKLLGRTLRDQGFMVTSLTNSDASASNIRKAILKLQSEAKSGDIIYIHFSCHGQPVEDLDGDEDDGWDEAIVPYDASKIYIKDKYNGENHITDDELNKYINIVRKKVGTIGFVYVSIDACHAGTSYRGEEEDSVFVRGTNNGFSASGKLFTPRIDRRGMYKVEKRRNSSGVCYLEACRSYQVNSEIREEGTYYGPLSYYINKVLVDFSLSKETSWIKKVNEMMNSDVRLVRQNMVVETSK